MLNSKEVSLKLSCDRTTLAAFVKRGILPEPLIERVSKNNQLAYFWQYEDVHKAIDKLAKEKLDNGGGKKTKKEHYPSKNSVDIINSIFKGGK